MKNFSVLLLIMLLSYTTRLSGQCSDGGACKFDDISKSDSYFSPGLLFSIRDKTTQSYSFNVSGNVELINSLHLNYSFAYTLVNSEFGTNSGFDDPIVGLNYKDVWNIFDISVAYRLPLGNINSKFVNNSNYDLPMLLQTGGGTHDILMFINKDWNEFETMLGLIIPFGTVSNNFNENFLPDTTKNDKYQNSNELIKQADILLRMTTSTELFGNIFSYGLLGIYRIANSSYIENSPVLDVASQRFEIENSKGLTLNLMANYIIDLNKDLNNNSFVNTIMIRIAVPIVNRQNFPDGVKRAFTFDLMFR